MLGPHGHDLAHLFVEVGNQPAAVQKAAFAVLVWASRRLHDAVQSQKRARDQLSHVSVLPSAY